jgi:D-glycero-D-manno-heptose 1,7-bisphosphate phosphatase
LARIPVFLDRDGVINRRVPGSYVRDWAEFELLPGVVDALAALSRDGAAIFIVTNQRGVARGLVEPASLEDIHARLTADLKAAGVDLTGIYVCPHDEGTCDCRKPGVGLFQQAADDHPWIRYADGHMVGDSISDAQAAAAIGIGHIWLVGQHAQATADEAAREHIAVAGTAPDLARLVTTELRLSAPG